MSLPADLALVSFDDPYFAPLLEPALTTILRTADIGAGEARRCSSRPSRPTAPTDPRVWGTFTW